MAERMHGRVVALTLHLPVESAIEDVLSKAGISYRKTKRAEKIVGFDQTPDFIIPSGFNPQVVIEAKLTEDDGTARDKVTRVQHLAELSGQAASRGGGEFEVIACIGGRGFGVGREDMCKLLLATRGKVFTLKTLRVTSSRAVLPPSVPRDHRWLRQKCSPNRKRMQARLPH